MKPRQPTELGRELVRFFEEFLPGQRGLSPNTIRSYLDAVMLLLQFLSRGTQRPFERLEIADLSDERVLRFLDPWKTNVATASQRAMPGLVPSTSSPVSWPIGCRNTWASCSG